jgi:hypothetical protein
MRDKARLSRTTRMNRSESGMRTPWSRPVDRASCRFAQSDLTVAATRWENVE